MMGELGKCVAMYLQVSRDDAEMVFGDTASSWDRMVFLRVVFEVIGVII